MHTYHNLPQQPLSHSCHRAWAAGCTKTIAPRGREDATCVASVLAISPHNTRQAFISLTYPATPTSGPRGSSVSVTYETLLTSCDGSAISTARLPQLRGAPPTSACWLSMSEVAVGCADGSCHIITLRRVALRERRGVPILQVNAATRVALELSQSLAGETIYGLAVLQGGEAADGCESLLSGRSSSVDGGEDTARSVVLATRGALVWYSGYGTFGKVLQTGDDAAGGRIVHKVDPGMLLPLTTLNLAYGGGEDGGVGWGVVKIVSGLLLVWHVPKTRSVGLCCAVAGA